MAQVTASEVIGELRKAARQYEVFQKAIAAIEVLVNEEKYLSQLKADIRSAEDDLAKLDHKLTAAMAANVKIVEDQKQQLDTFVAQKSKEQAEFDAKVVVARKQAIKIVEDAKGEVSRLEMDIAKLKVQRRDAEEATVGAMQRLEAVNQAIKARKEAILGM